VGGASFTTIEPGGSTELARGVVITSAGTRTFAMDVHWWSDLPSGTYQARATATRRARRSDDGEVDGAWTGHLETPAVTLVVGP